MFTILLCAIIGFLAGLGIVMKQRNIKPGPMLSAVFLGLMSLGIWKNIRHYANNKRTKKHF